MLRDYIALHPGVYGKVGCANGSAFVIAGQITDEAVKRADERNIEYLQAKIKRYKKNNQKSLQAQAEFDLESYKPLALREVKEVYDSIIEDGTIIIIEGSENGDYWTNSEV